MISKTLLRALNGHITDQGLQALCDSLGYSYSEAKLTCRTPALSLHEQELAAEDAYNEGHRAGLADAAAE